MAGNDPDEAKKSAKGDPDPKEDPKIEVLVQKDQEHLILKKYNQ